MKSAASAVQQKGAPYPDNCGCQDKRSFGYAVSVSSIFWAKKLSRNLIACAAAGLALSALSFTAMAADNLTVEIDWSKAPASQSQFALPQAVSISSASDGSWSAGGARSTWSLTVTVPEAISTSFAADQVKLPLGTTLTIQGSDGVPHALDTTLGASGQFWSDIVQGDTFTLVASVPTALASNFNLHLFEIQGGYKAPFAKSAKIKSAGAGQTENYACVQDATNIYAARATAAIVVNNTSGCTGTLVNDGAGDFKPYFLTAAHCAGESNLTTNDYTTSAQSIKAYWGAQTACGQTLGYASSDATAMTTGATHRARSGDVWLVELAQSVPSTAYYEGFDASGSAVTNVYDVHHGNRLDRQWFAGTANNNGSSSPEVTLGETLQIATGNFSDGTSKPGSSGSGIVDATSKRLLGVLNGSNITVSFSYSPLADVYASGFSTYLGSGLTTNGAEPPPAPPASSLSSSASSVTVGNSLTLTWSTTSVSSCTASASPAQSDWSGTVSNNGSASVTPAAVGSVTYTLTCTGNDTTTLQRQQTVQVNAASSGGGGGGGTGGGGGGSSGGGAFGLATLIPMLLVGLRRKRILELDLSIG